MKPYCAFNNLSFLLPHIDSGKGFPLCRILGDEAKNNFKPDNAGIPFPIAIAMRQRVQICGGEVYEEVTQCNSF